MKKYLAIGMVILGIGFLMIILNWNRDPKIYMIGTLGDYSSVSSNASFSALKAVEIAIDELNEAYGETRYEIVHIDSSEIDSQKDLENIIKKEKIVAIIGPNSTTELDDIYPYLEGIQVPIFLTSISSKVIDEIDDNVFRLTDSMSKDISVTTKLLQSYLNVDNLTILYTEDNRKYSEAYADDIITAFKDKNVRKILVGNIAKDEEKEKLINLEAVDGVLIIAGPGTAGIIAQLISVNNPTATVMLNVWSASETTATYTKGLPNRIISLAPSKMTDQESFDAFANKMVSVKKTDYSIFAYYGYEATYFMDYINNAVGGFQLQKIKNYIHNIELYKGRFNDYKFNEFGDGGRGYALTEVIDGSYKYIREKLDVDIDEEE